MLDHMAQQKAIENILETFDGNMARVILEVEKLISRWLLSNDINAVTALEFDKVIDMALTESGYYDAVNRLVGKDFDRLYPMIQEGLAMGGLFSTYTAEDLAKITGLKALEANKFSVLANNSSSVMRDNLYRYVLSDFTVEDIAKNVANDFGNSPMVKYSNTLANTVVAEMQQTTLDIEAEELDGVYLYVGPLDGVTRDFCADTLEDREYYDKKQKIKIQTDPLRKYNCRHRLRLVSLEYAKDNGYKKSNI